MRPDLPVPGSRAPDLALVYRGPLEELVAEATGAVRRRVQALLAPERTEPTGPTAPAVPGGGGAGGR